MNVNDAVTTRLLKILKEKNITKYGLAKASAIPVTFAIRLKELREEKGFTQNQLAKLLFVSKQNISDWENGKSETNFEMAIKIATVFDVTVGQLLGSEEL